MGNIQKPRASGKVEGKEVVHTKHSMPREVQHLGPFRTSGTSSRHSPYLEMEISSNSESLGHRICCCFLAMICVHASGWQA
eukprot:1157143-Pelagomonas_calceolata.AAC.8